MTADRKINYWGSYEGVPFNVKLNENRSDFNELFSNRKYPGILIYSYDESEPWTTNDAGREDVLAEIFNIPQVNMDMFDRNELSGLQTLLGLTETTYTNVTIDGIGCEYTALLIGTPKWRDDYRNSMNSGKLDECIPELESWAKDRVFCWETLGRGMEFYVDKPDSKMNIANIKKTIEMDIKECIDDALKQTNGKYVVIGSYAKVIKPAADGDFNFNANENVTFHVKTKEAADEIASCYMGNAEIMLAKEYKEMTRDRGRGN